VVKSLLVESLKAVTDAEARAETILAEAAAGAKQMIEEARVSGREQTARMLAEAEKMAEDIRLKSEADAQKETAAAKRRAKAECAGLRSAAMENMDRVADMIVERVVNG
jgi:cell division septum initiation protein DivIVA